MAKGLSNMSEIKLTCLYFLYFWHTASCISQPGIVSALKKWYLCTLAVYCNYSVCLEVNQSQSRATVAGTFQKGKCLNLSSLLYAPPHLTVYLRKSNAGYSLTLTCWVERLNLNQKLVSSTPSYSPCHCRLAVSLSRYKHQLNVMNVKCDVSAIYMHLTSHSWTSALSTSTLKTFIITGKYRL